MTPEEFGDLLAAETSACTPVVTITNSEIPDRPIQFGFSRNEIDMFHTFLSGVPAFVNLQKRLGNFEGTTKVVITCTCGCFDPETFEV